MCVKKELTLQKENLRCIQGETHVGFVCFNAAPLDLLSQAVNAPTLSQRHVLRKARPRHVHCTGATSSGGLLYMRFIQDDSFIHSDAEVGLQAANTPCVLFAC